MEQVLRMRLKARREGLLRQINFTIDLKSRLAEGGLPLKDLMEAKIKLQSTVNAFEAECLRIAEYFKEEDRASQEEYIRDQMQAEDLLADLDLISKLNKDETVPSNQAVTTKLPKLEMMKFDGDIQKWPEFWAKFENSIHRQNLDDTDKLSYLFSCLTGKALETLRGIDITKDNYLISLEILKKRFGDKDLVVDAHYDALNNLERATEGTARTTLDTINKHIRILKTYGENVAGNFFRNLVYNKFPEGILYELNLLVPKERTLDIVLETLERVIQAKERSKEVQPMHQSVATTEVLHVKAPRKPEKRKLPGKKEEKDSGKRRKRQCTFCDGSHFDDQCTEYKTSLHRRKRLAAKRLCFKCFKIGHIASKCGNQLTCYHCKGNHNRALCGREFSKTKQAKDKKPNNEQEPLLKITGKNPGTEKKVTTSKVFEINVNSYLQTAKALLKNNGAEVPVRVLMDCGSQRTYLTKRLAKKLNIIPDEEDLLMVYTFGKQTPKEITSPSAIITLVTKRGVTKKLRVNIVPHITERLPVAEMEPCEGVDFYADDNSVGESVDLLIGNDYYLSFLRPEHIKLKENLYLINSDFGWLISGKINEGEFEANALSIVTYCQCHQSGCPYFTEPDLPLRTIDIQFLWTLESIGIIDSPRTTREEEAVKVFNETTRYVEGRYEVKWPWIEYPPDLPTNFGLAYGRLKGLMKRSDQQTLEEYNNILKEQLEAKIIEVVEPSIDPSTQRSPPVHYLPHHMVKQAGKKGRLVYDASAKIKGEKSLNECLYSGPSMLEDLIGLILKFRTGRIGITADVEKAFLQVALQDEDRDVTRFLWVKDVTKPLVDDNLIHLRFCRVPFGIISSPFLLTATIRHHIAMTDKSLLPKIADRCYVDNLILSVNSEDEALQLYKETRKVFSDISMNIRDWNSNSRNFMERIPEDQRANESEEMKILGLVWNLAEDNLKLNLERLSQTNNKDQVTTKRDVLRTLSRLYDPCGFVSPTILPAKIIFQELCILKLKWDEPLPTALEERWSRIQANFMENNVIKVPRFLGNSLPEGKEVRFELHCFCDASKEAYAAAAYLRTTSQGTTKTNLLMSKSRVTPADDKNDLKIPRLELLAFLIGSRLIKYIKDNLGLDISRQTLWTDSQVVLAWTKTSKLLPPFVQRRVNEIKQNKELEMRYVNTKVNPADIATRPELWQDKQDLWFHGPDFLLQEEEYWPSNTQVHMDHSLVAGEALDVLDGPETLQRNEEEPMEFDETVLEFTVPSGDEESEKESVNNIKKLQFEFFPEEVSGKETHLTRNLGLFKDVDGLLRCRGRMTNTDWSYDKKHPILIPKDSSFTIQVIKKAHEDNFHVGVSHTLSIIRQKYWIPQGRAQVQKILRRCAQCVKHGGGPYELPAAPALPEERVNFSTPFTYVGMDYFGPLYVDTNTGREKRWICLFTCLAIRAVHLEVVKDLTSEDCLLALRRFIAVRGLPKKIISDNALYFKLVSEVLSSPYCKENGIQWRFITQLAPWHGGFYERLVALVKNCLKRTLGKHLLNDNQLLTIIKEIETVINSRPLTCVGAELEHVLKPSDFLSLGNCLTPVPSNYATGSETTTKIDLLKSWRKGHAVMSDFENMFANQYLTSLMERYNHSHRQPRVKADRQPKVGDIVQLKDDSRNRENWKVGKISSLIRSADGQYRTAKVLVGDKEFTRSIGHLYPLEADIHSEVSEIPRVQPEEELQDAFLIETPEELVGHPEVSQSGVTEMEVAEVPVEASPDDSQIPVGQVEVETEAVDWQLPLSNLQETVDQGLQVEEPRLRRDAAIRARERIAEWTRQLAALL